tara:strand:+ start:526 stop:840 length:315 start_codon:yes stop_codon:yes gene_type:complete
MAKTKQNQTEAYTTECEETQSSSIFESKTLYARIVLMLLAFNFLLTGYATYVVANIQGEYAEGSQSTVTQTTGTTGTTEATKPLDTSKPVIGFREKTEEVNKEN